MDTTNERVSIEVGDRTMAGYLARPAGDGKWPGVVLFMEIFGVNAYIRSVADRIAGEGYVVLAPDLFHRSAPGIELGYDGDALQRGIELVSQTRPGEILTDVRESVAALQARADVAGDGVGAVGFCFGGHVAYRAACELPIKATVSFYGGGIASPAAGGEPATVDLSGAISGRIVCLFGEDDGYISADDVARIRAALESHDVRHEVVVYPGVGHGFFCHARDDYDETASADAWHRLTALLASELV